jgi:hypothetical protein
LGAAPTESGCTGQAAEDALRRERRVDYGAAICIGSVLPLNSLQRSNDDPKQRQARKRGHIMDSVAGSLDRLGVDHIDLYQFPTHRNREFLRVTAN